MPYLSQPYKIQTYEIPLLGGFNRLNETKSLDAWRCCALFFGAVFAI